MMGVASLSSSSSETGKRFAVVIVQLYIRLKKETDSATWGEG